jgi:hypothetical protein
MAIGTMTTVLVFIILSALGCEHYKHDGQGTIKLLCKDEVTLQWKFIRLRGFGRYNKLVSNCTIVTEHKDIKIGQSYKANLIHDGMHTSIAKAMYYCDILPDITPPDTTSEKIITSKNEWIADKLPVLYEIRKIGIKEVEPLITVLKKMQD